MQPVETAPIEVPPVVLIVVGALVGRSDPADGVARTARLGPVALIVPGVLVGRSARVGGVAPIARPVPVALIVPAARAPERSGSGRLIVPAVPVGLIVLAAPVAVLGYAGVARSGGRPDRAGGGRPDRARRSLRRASGPCGWLASGPCGGLASGPCGWRSRPDRGAADRRPPEGARRVEDKAPRRVEPALPSDVTGDELDRQVRGELGTLSKDNATIVARHLVMVARLMDEEPELAYEHAVAAQHRAGRVGLVREAAGLAAYQVGRYDDALRELRTARRLTGSSEHLPVMADCERGLGRPERALDLASSPEASRLDRAGQLEMLIVAAGARGDLGQHDAAVVMLQVAELDVPPAPGRARPGRRVPG